MGELIPAWSYGATDIVPADGYGDGMVPAGSSNLIPAAPYLGEVVEPADDGLCIEKTKAGNPCKGRKVLDTDYCFSHVRKHCGVHSTADQGLRP